MFWIIFEVNVMFPRNGDFMERLFTLNGSLMSMIKRKANISHE